MHTNLMSLKFFYIFYFFVVDRFQLLRSSSLMSVEYMIVHLYIYKRENEKKANNMFNVLELKISKMWAYVSALIYDGSQTISREF